MAGNGYATTSRKKILEYLMANSDRTVTVTDIDQYLKKHDNEVNITTIYRYLDKLAKEGTVMKYVAEKGSQAVYQYVEMGHHCEEHLHLKCVSCGCHPCTARFPRRYAPRNDTTGGARRCTGALLHWNSPIGSRK